MMNTSGITFKDHAGSMVRTTRLLLIPGLHITRPCLLTLPKQDLCYAALSFASDTLKADGNFVCKFYQGKEDKALEDKLKKMFKRVCREKPESSRSVSSVVCVVNIRCWNKSPVRPEVYALNAKSSCAHLGIEGGILCGVTKESPRHVGRHRGRRIHNIAKLCTTSRMHDCRHICMGSERLIVRHCTRVEG